MSDVNVTVGNSDHLEYEELLPAAAFGTLTPEEQQLLQAHLATCDSCRAILAEYREIAAVLPLTLDEEVAPSAGLRDKIAVAVGAEQAARETPVAQPVTPVQPVTRTAPTPIRSAKRFNPGWLAAVAAMLIVALVCGAVLNRTFFTDEPDVETIAMTFEGEPYANTTGEVKYLEDDHVFLVETENLPALPEGQVYQVWMIDTEVGPKPIGAIDTTTGTFALTADRNAYDVLAITVEPGPLGSAAPTTDPFAVADLAADGD